MHAQGMRHLVRYDHEGRPANINYSQISVYLLELMKQHESSLAAEGQRIETQQRTNGEQQRTIETLLARVQELERQVGAD